MSKLNAIQERTGSKGELPATENFALQVTNYTKDGKDRDAIAGIRLDTGEEAIVILRPYKGDKPLRAARAEVKDFIAKDGEISTLMQNLPTDEMRKQVLKGMKAKTEPGGVVLIQRAYVERDTGVVSAGWIQSAAKYPDHCKVVPNVLLRIDPVTYRENPKDKSQQMSYSYATAVHTSQSQAVKSLDEFKAAMQSALSGNAVMGGRPLALIRLSDGEQSKAIEFALPAKVDRTTNEVTVFTPANAVTAFLESESGKSVASLVGDPDLKIEVIPGNKVSIGSQAKASYKNAGGLEQVNTAYRFKREDQGETGFTPSYVVLHQVGDGWVFSSAQPLSNKPSLFHPRDVATPHYDGRPAVVMENKEVPAHAEAPVESRPEAPGHDDFNIDDVVGQHMQQGNIPTAPRMRA